MTGATRTTTSVAGRPRPEAAEVLATTGSLPPGAAVTTATSGRRGRRGRGEPGARARVLLPVVSVVAGVGLLQLAVRAGWLDPAFTPAPSEIAAALGSRFDDGTLLPQIGATLQGVLAATGLALVIAVPVGILMGAVPAIGHALHYVVEFLRPLPSVAIIPLIVLMFGPTMQSKIALATFGAVWPLLVMVIVGVASVDPVMRDSARSYGLSWLQRIRYVTLPSALPFAATGLRLSVTTALLLSVTSEIVVGMDGIGQTLGAARLNGNVPLMYAMVVVTGVLGVVVNGLTLLAERRLLHWHPSQRRGGAR